MPFWAFCLMPFAGQVLHYDWWTHGVCPVFSILKNFFFFVIHGSSFFIAEESTHTNVLISTQLKNWYLWKAFSGLLSSLCALLCKFLPLWDPRFCFFSSGRLWGSAWGLHPRLQPGKELPLGSVQEINLDFSPSQRFLFCATPCWTELMFMVWKSIHFSNMFFSFIMYRATCCF